MSDPVETGPAEAEDARIGALLQDRYLVKERLAAGGMGVIYRGERVKLERAVAIKFLHAAVAAHPNAMKRFEREAMTMSRLTHPNCVSVIDIGIHESAPFIVMDFITGKNLTELLNELGRIAPGRAIHITLQILAALSHAHAQEMVHRDIKPANVMLSDAAGTADHVFVLDFGLAKFYRDALGDGLTAAHALLGTPAYMSPEQAKSSDVGPSSDIYSTGILLFELITGEKPFTGKTNYDLLQAHKFTPAPSIRARMGATTPISQELDEVLQIAMGKTPEERFVDVDAFANALGGVPETATYQPRLVTGQVAALARRASSAKILVQSKERGPVAMAGTQHLDSRDVMSLGASVPSGDTANDTNDDTTGARDTADGAGDAPSHDTAEVDHGRADTFQPPPEVMLEIAGGPARDEETEVDPRPPSVRFAELQRAQTPGHTLIAHRAPAGGASDRRRWLYLGIAAVAALGLVALLFAGSAAVDEASSEDPEPGAPVASASDAGSSDSESDRATDAAIAVRPVTFVRDVDALMDERRYDEAIAGIDKLLASTHENNAYLYMLRGDALFALKRPRQGLAAYSKAIRYKRKYASRRTLNSNAIGALARNDLHATVKRLYTRQIKRAGRAFLVRAARSHDSPVVRKRAARLADTLR